MNKTRRPPMELDEIRFMRQGKLAYYYARRRDTDHKVWEDLAFFWPTILAAIITAAFCWWTGR